MKKYWFCADLHLQHKMLIESGKRNFKSLDEMNNKIINELFENVKYGHTLFILGDFIFNVSDYAKAILSKLKKENIEIHFILGNHDPFSKSFYNEYCASVSEIKRVKINKHRFFLCHYPLLTWMNVGLEYMVHGHCHKPIEYPEFIRPYILNINYDVINKSVISYEEIIEIFNSRVKEKGEINGETN